MTTLECLAFSIPKPNASAGECTRRLLAGESVRVFAAHGAVTTFQLPPQVNTAAAPPIEVSA
jgi:hypothetical protein